jgi:hypothetical protein
MNFFDYQDNSIRTAPNLWIFFAVSIPVTMLAFALWQFFARPADDSSDLEAAAALKPPQRTYTAHAR